jgi:hypothetical protein
MSDEPSPSWRCFHCDEVFTDWGAARNHFGYTPEDGAPVCRVEGGVAAQLYHCRRQLEQYRQEDTPLHREIAALRADHATALRREEEKGYARGLTDARAQLALNPAMVRILGRPTFLCIGIAELLRVSGQEIPRKAEAEQAAVAHWSLMLYLTHGDGWMDEGGRQLEEISRSMKR